MGSLDFAKLFEFFLIAGFVLTTIIWAIYERASLLRMALRLPFFLMFFYLATFSLDTIGESEFIIMGLILVTILGPIEIWEKFTGRRLNFSRSKTDEIAEE